MSFYTLYDGSFPFTGAVTMPIITKSEEAVTYGSRYGMKETLVLDGFITGHDRCDPTACSTINYFQDAQQQIVDAFSSQYKNFSLIETDSLLDPVENYAVYEFERKFDSIVIETSGTFEIGNLIQLEYYGNNIPESIFKVTGIYPVPSGGTPENVYIGFESPSEYNYWQLYENPQNLRKIATEGGIHYTKPWVQTRSINFDNSNYFGIQPYSITLDAYCLDCWSGEYGVLDPVDEVSYSQTDCEVTINRRIAAKGFNARSNISDAYNNAKKFVCDRTGVNNVFQPSFVSTGDYFLLESVDEKINHLEASHEVNETYRYLATGKNNSGLSRLVYNFSSGENGGQATLEGSLFGGKGVSTAVLMAHARNLNPYKRLKHYYDEIAGAYDGDEMEFRPYLSSATLDHDPKNNTVNFSLIYLDGSVEDPYVIDEVELEDNIVDGKKCISASFEFRSNFGCTADRYSRVYDYYKTFDRKAYLKDKWENFFYQTGELYGKAEIESTFYNEQEGIIRSNVKFCERGDDYSLECFKKIDYKISCKIGLNQYNPCMSCVETGAYIIQDLGFSDRSTFSINGNGIIEKDCSNKRAIEELKQFLFIQSNLYCNGTNKTLDSWNIVYDVEGDNKDVSFGASWSFHKEDPYSQYLNL